MVNEGAPFLVRVERWLGGAGPWLVGVLGAVALLVVIVLRNATP